MSTALAANAFDQFARAQPAAVAALRSAVASDQVAHAWLLLGPAGSGQQEATRLLGAALNCESPSDGMPCTVCPPCVRIIRGAHTAVRDFLPEGSFHRVRDVRDQWIPMATRSSIDGRFKVLRIAAAERMNEAAQNAFLKILEEPPPSVVWILDVANDAALLDTIISRCRRLDLRPWSQDLLRERLDLWVDAGEGDPGIGSGAEVIKVTTGRASVKKGAVEHLETPTSAERAALVRLAKGSPDLLSELSTCDGRRVRTVAVETVDRILDLGPRGAGGVAPLIANEVLEIIVAAQGRHQARAEADLEDLGNSLGMHMTPVANGWAKPGKGERFPAGVEKAFKDRVVREQRDIATTTCRRYLDLVATVLHDMLVVQQSGGTDGVEGALKNLDRLSSLARSAPRVDPVGLVEALEAIETAHLAFDLNGDRKLQLERAIIRIVLACARG